MIIIIIIIIMIVISLYILLYYIFICTYIFFLSSIYTYIYMYTFALCTDLRCICLTSKSGESARGAMIVQVITYNATIAACGAGGIWLHAVRQRISWDGEQP